MDIKHATSGVEDDKEMILKRTAQIIKQKQIKREDSLMESFLLTLQTDDLPFDKESFRQNHG
jgi:hypothetical protein